MDVLLSISAWCNFLLSRLLLDAVFIVAAILFVFALFNRKEYQNTSALRFIITALIITMVSRYVYFVYMDTKINSRYLLSLAFYLVILCVPGFPVIVKLGGYLNKFTIFGKNKILPYLLLTGIGIACLGKAMHTPERKHYLHDAAKIMKAYFPAVLISNIKDSRRIAWHSNADLIHLSLVFSADNPDFCENALEKLKGKNDNIFLFVKYKDIEFRKFFSDKNVKFPENLILLKEFAKRGKRFYSLYKVRTEQDGGK